MYPTSYSAVVIILYHKNVHALVLLKNCVSFMVLNRWVKLSKIQFNKLSGEAVAPFNAFNKALLTTETCVLLL
jgi:hypothetical protein